MTLFYNFAPRENEVTKICFIYCLGGVTELAGFKIQHSLHLQSPKFTTSRAVTIIFTKLKLVFGVVDILLFSQSTKPGLKWGKSPVPSPY